VPFERNATGSTWAPSIWKLSGPFNRHNDSPAPIAFATPEAVLQVEHRQEWRQPQTLLQAARRYQLGMAADALDLDEMAGAKIPDPHIVERRISAAEHRSERGRQSAMLRRL
jgi:hypothetical protein